MDVHLTNPELQAKLNQWVTETGRSVDELIEDAMAGYFAELAQVRTMLDTRYDEVKSGKVKLVPGDEVLTGLRAKSAALRANRS